MIENALDALETIITVSVTVLIGAFVISMVLIPVELLVDPGWCPYLERLTILSLAAYAIGKPVFKWMRS